MEDEVSRRGFLKGLASLAVAATIPNNVQSQSCNPNKRTILNLLTPVMSNPKTVITDLDGKIYLTFSTDLKMINELIMNTDKYDLVSSKGKEPVYQTLNEALKALDPENTYVIEMDLRGINPGSISNVYTRNGDRLQSSLAFRCLDSSLIFKEDERRKIK